MLEFLSKAILHFIEQEFAKAQPELEAMVIEQMKNLSEQLLAYIEKALGADREKSPALENKTEE